MDVVGFLHHENPPTWAGVISATLGEQDQRQTNYAIQQARSKLQNYMAAGISLNLQKADSAVKALIRIAVKT
ncbi:hypothetical protein TNCV_578691 [Trichonephila clavipes]|nr:hypothetical protein TNCV_578691 [Trichonephila clavipes]